MSNMLPWIPEILLILAYLVIAEITCTAAMPSLFSSD